jgi:hypothetical protein
VSVYRVHDYATGEALDGTPSPELVAASLAEPTGTGAVRGFWEPSTRLARGAWGLAPAGAILGRTVYVVEVAS